MFIDAIRLLTKDEYLKYKSIIPQIKQDWWLQTSSECYPDTNAYTVTIRNELITKDKISSLGVRPVLVIKDLIIFPGDNIELFGFDWTVLDNNLYNTIILCNSTIDKHYFDKMGQNWIFSGIRGHVNNWLFKQQLSSEIIVLYNGETEFLFLQSLCKKFHINELQSSLFHDYGYLVYSPYHQWRLVENIGERPTLSFSEFCDYITKENN